MVRVGFLYTRLRKEEKWLIKELESRSCVETVRIPDGGEFFDIAKKPALIDILFSRFWDQKKT